REQQVVPEQAAGDDLGGGLGLLDGVAGAAQQPGEVGRVQVGAPGEAAGAVGAGPGVGLVPDLPGVDVPGQVQRQCAGGAAGEALGVGVVPAAPGRLGAVRRPVA